MSDIQEIMDRLAKIWQEILGVGAMGPDDEFFAIGGDSVKAVKMLMIVEQRFGVEIQCSLIAKSSTIRKMSFALEPLLNVAQEPMSGGSEVGEV